MKQDSANKKIKVKLFSGLGGTLTISLLMFTLGPMAMISWFSYQAAYKSLKKEKEISLKTTAVLKMREINAYFNEMMKDLKHYSETDLTRGLLEKLENLYQESGESLEKFVQSSKWKIIIDESASDFKKFRKAYNYYDIFLLNKNGDIIYTVKGERDLGTNLMTGEHSSTKFAVAVRMSFETGKIVFSDYERYYSSKNNVFGFITNPVLNKNGEIIGVIAFQFSIDHINNIMQAKTEMGKTAETYLIGSDLKLRSKLLMAKEKDFINDMIITEQTKLLKKHIDNNNFDKINEDVFVYKGPYGKSVLGVHYKIMIANIRFAAISEIEETEAFASVSKLRRTMIFVVSLTIFAAVIFIIILVRRMIRPLLFLSSSVKKVEHGDFSELIEINSKNEIGDLAISFNSMIESLKKTTEEKALQDWFMMGQVAINNIISGVSDPVKLSNSIVSFLAEYLNADIGAVYIVKNKNILNLTGTYAFSTRKNISSEYEFGQGLVGQAALEKKQIILLQVPEDYIVISSGLGDTVPHTIVIQPCIRNDEVICVIELGAIEDFSEKAVKFINNVSEYIAVAFQTIISHNLVQDLLKKSQTQTMELEIKQEELSKSNINLEKQADALKESEGKLQQQQNELYEINRILQNRTTELKKSEENLKIQQKELRQTNQSLNEQSAELEEQTAQLEIQKSEIEKKNIDLKKAKGNIEEKANALEKAGKYKSEFLANMSHELRTPLNSILLLSKHLASNKKGNLDEKQVECASTVNTSGNELLLLINDVLDLSKIEAGHITLEITNIAVNDIVAVMERNFKAVAKANKVDFNIIIAKEVPEFITTDEQRLAQILKNLLANAFKFTAKGSVTLEISIYAPEKYAPKKNDTLEKFIAFKVRDTGFGIAAEKQELVFQAFKQADGSINRKHGGTGLGLSISSGYASLLGGEITLKSKEGDGCTFTLYIPCRIKETKSENHKIKSAELNENSVSSLTILNKKESENFVEEKYISDDRNNIKSESRSILIIEDDPKFAKIIRDVAREKSFKALVAETGETGLQMANFYIPDGIIMDIGLPGINGKTVLSRLKENLSTRHIPVHVISALDKTFEPLQMGAMGYYTKPVSMEVLDSVFAKIEKFYLKKIKDVLLVEDNKSTQMLISNLIEDETVKVTIVSTGEEAKKIINEKEFDCIILDIGLPDMSGIDLLKELRKVDDFHIPVIVHTIEELTSEQRIIIDEFAGTIILKDTKSCEKLLDETALFLHRVESDLPEEKRKILQMIHNTESIFENKKILVVDDDMRNVFALINILEEKKMITIVAKDGDESIKILEKNPDTNLVLMDIMMPKMDGYEAMSKIRRMDSKICKVPIIALTAKAMKGDKAKCISAGANDYLSKPVDTDKLLSMLRVWLY